jgi:hypothetical protein
MQNAKFKRQGYPTVVGWQCPGPAFHFAICTLQFEFTFEVSHA